MLGKKKKNQGYISQNRLYYFNQSFQGICERELVSKAQHVWQQPVRFSRWFLSAQFCLLYLLYSNKCLSTEAIPIVNLGCQQDNSKVPPLILSQFPTRNCHFSSILFWVTLPALLLLRRIFRIGNLRSEQWRRTLLGCCCSAAVQGSVFSLHGAESEGDA